MPDETGDITLLLNQWRHGDKEAEEELFRKIDPDLRRLAHYIMSRERKDHPLQATELVNQIYLKFPTPKEAEWHNRKHFFALVARAMRRHLIDIARGRPKAEFVPLEKLEPILPAQSMKVGDVLMIDRLLNQLEAHQPVWCQLVELKYFLGMTDDEVADTLGIKLRSMQRMWHEARKWLFEQFGSINESDDPS